MQAVMGKKIKQKVYTDSCEHRSSTEEKRCIQMQDNKSDGWALLCVNPIIMYN